MAQTFPFTRAKAGGWAFGEKLTSAQQNTVDLNAAQAADGLLYTDRALLRNFRPSLAVTDTGHTAVWSPGLGTGGKWLLFGNSGTQIVIKAAFRDGAGSAGQTVPTLDLFFLVADHDGSGLVVAGGDPVSGSGASKYAASSDDGTNWSIGTSTDTLDSVNVDALIWSSTASMFIAGLSDGTIETSTNGTSWVSQTTPNSDARRPPADSGSIILVPTSGSSDKYITSTNGTTWTERTLPAADVHRFVWLPSLSLFISAGDSNTYSSSDGIAWSSAGLTAHPLGIFTSSKAAAMGRIMVLIGTSAAGGNIASTIDGGKTWEHHTDLGSVSEIIAGDDQWAAMTTDIFLATWSGGS